MQSALSSPLLPSSMSFMDWTFRASHCQICSLPSVFLMVFLLVGACSAPPRFSFAELKEDYLHNRTFSTSEVVEYRCRPGYVRNYRARNTYICEKNSWKGSNNFCLREYIWGWLLILGESIGSLGSILVVGRWWQWDLSGCCLPFTSDSGCAQKCIFLSGTCEHLVQ